MRPRAPSSTETVRWGASVALKPAVPLEVLTSSVVVGDSKLVARLVYTVAAGPSRRLRPALPLPSRITRRPLVSALWGRSWSRTRKASRSQRAAPRSSTRETGSQRTCAKGPSSLTVSRWSARISPVGAPASLRWFLRSSRIAWASSPAVSRSGVPAPRTGRVPDSRTPPARRSIVLYVPLVAVTGAAGGVLREGERARILRQRRVRQREAHAERAPGREDVIGLPDKLARLRLAVLPEPSGAELGEREQPRPPAGAAAGDRRDLGGPERPALHAEPLLERRRRRFGGEGGHPARGVAVERPGRAGQDLGPAHDAELQVGELTLAVGERLRHAVDEHLDAAEAEVGAAPGAAE